MKRPRFLTLVLSALVLVVGVIVAGILLTRNDPAPASSLHQGLGVHRSHHSQADNMRSAEPTFAVNISRPFGRPLVNLVDEAGLMHAVSCTVCHSMREPDFTNRTTANLQQFHQDMTFAHGDLSCLSCHNPDHYNALRLADGQTIAYRDVMTLCAQCHGPQHRDYLNGAHGGMTGYWDLSRGPRTRNGCTDCHDPHAPKFPAMVPTFKPRDRFLTPPGSKVEETHD